MADYLELLNRICQPVRRGDYPATLQPMRDLLDNLGSPHESLRAVVVTGSTGKGTTCHRIAAMLRAVGLNVGLYTSPHLHSFRERFVYNGQMIDEAAFINGAEAVTAAAERIGHPYSTFEQATALALWWFARQKADLVVLEIGIGGRWDAVNVVDNILAVFTPIEAEHLAMLGGSLESVAWHKAGIIQPGGQALSVPQTDVVSAILGAEAEAQGAALKFAAGEDLARVACQNLLDRGLIPSAGLPQRMETASLPGRLERVTINGRAVLIDGGHTPAAARILRGEIARLTGEDDPVRMIVGLLNDKNARAYLEYFDSPQFRLILTRPPGHRAASPGDIRQQVGFQQASADIVPDVYEVLTHVREAEEPLVVVAGSLRMAAIAREAFGLLSPAELEEARATRALFEGDGYLSKLPPDDLFKDG